MFFRDIIRARPRRGLSLQTLDLLAIVTALLLIGGGIAGYCPAIRWRYHARL